MGRPRKLSPAQASLIFECQVQILAAQQLIDRTLDEAGLSVNRAKRSYAMMTVWRARGRVDVPIKQLVAMPGITFPGRPKLARRVVARDGGLR
jgi:hypothetical protein